MIPHILFYKSPAQQYRSVTRKIFKEYPCYGDYDNYDLQLFQAQWKASSHNLVQYGYYVNWLLGANCISDNGFDISRYERDLITAEKLDLDNANYHYALARLYVDRSVDRQNTKDNKPDAITGLSYYYRVRNRHLLDRAMHEFMLGLAMPSLRRYHHEFMLERLKLLPPVRTTEGHFLRWMIITGDTHPEFYGYQRLAEVSLSYGRLLLAGRAPAGSHTLSHGMEAAGNATTQ